MKTIRSVLACIIMGLAAYFGSLTLQCVHLWMAVVQPRIWRWYIDITMYMWISTTVWLMEWMIGLKIRLFGDAIKESDRAIFIMNHRTRLDWIYLYGVLMRYGWSLCDEKIVLKHELKRIPGAGWAMQCSNYMFLRRNFQSDKFYLSNMLEYFCSLSHKTKILLFPEGTDLNTGTLVKSNKFAEKFELPCYKYVLHPRTMGFVHLAQEYIKFSKANGEKFDAVYDLTVAYPDKEFATNELGFLLGQSSSEIHFLCRRYAIEEIIGDDDLISDELQSIKLKDFIIKVWQEKEETLSNYYTGTESGDSNVKHFNKAEQHLQSFMFMQWLSLIVICGNMLLCIIALILIPRIFFPIIFLLNLVFISIDIFKNGVDDLVLRLTLNDKYREYNLESDRVSDNDNDELKHHSKSE